MKEKGFRLEQVVYKVVSFQVLFFVCSYKLFIDLMCDFLHVLCIRFKSEQTCFVSNRIGVHHRLLVAKIYS